MIKTSLKTGLIAASLLVSSQLSFAEVVEVPVASQAQDKQSIVRPRVGMNEMQVIDLVGEPLNATAPVGEPPIARWEYADFYVYFEHDLVLHSVLKHTPKGEAADMDAAEVDPSKVDMSDEGMADDMEEGELEGGEPEME